MKAWLRILMVLLLSGLMTVSAWAITLREAAERVARQYEGRVVSAQTVERDGRRVHVIRVLTRDGVVRTVRVPADGD
ncbi:PepSY domain-containing protein [Wenzhouxiangella marina]|uniref:Uncharacterized protein n=1 Tax=Wenzhouxiangella marina TaxID=1579979 RepID=A0A0K0XUT7_9GAMM|nr:hypothetical protein [Wenzhouxiangella marina]AKS41430.1 hypothetical protein WM2015_1053 [Wenzhouxiangella marina]MBB6086816.1 putative membrane protein YkoI [Wenzhouxiangella marina]